MVRIGAITMISLLLVVAKGGPSLCVAETGAPKGERTLRWLLGLPAELHNWLKTVQHKPTRPGEPWGLFAFCVDSKIPYSIPSTSIAWSDAESCGGIEKMPGYHPKAKEETAASPPTGAEPAGWGGAERLSRDRQRNRAARFTARRSLWAA